MSDSQLEFNFEGPFSAGENPALWTPRDIWVRLNQRMMPHFGEDNRIDYKSGGSVHLDDFAKYLSMFSNTPDGGVIVYGASSRGIPQGCSKLSHKQINELERCHIQRCPAAQPEFKRIPVVVDGNEDFCIAIYIPYLGKLAETNKAKSYIRYGDSCHEMTPDEMRDFRASRQELSFEMEAAPYNFPDDFDLRLIQDFCDQFRSRESRHDWTNNEVLLDRKLLDKRNGKLVPLNALVLLAARDPRRTIPGSRVRVQRFSGTQEGVGSTYSPIRDRYLEGNLVHILQESIRVIEDLNYDVTWLNNEGKFVQTKEYPRMAWLEALVNACVHRSYSFSGSEVTVKFFDDRLEIESPGGFVPPVNAKTIYSLRASRNANLMDAMRILGYVQMAREGTRRMRESMREFGLPEPTFSQEVVHGVLVRVTLQNDSETRKRATDRDVAQFFGVDIWKTLQEWEVKIAAHVFRNSTIQVSEASRLTGRTWQTSKKDLERMVRKGILIFVPGEYTRDPSAHYRLRENDESN